MALSIVLAYDISSNNSRAKVAAMISVWGDRIQRSVYQCMLDEKALDELLARIDQVVDHNSDAVHVFVQCSDCTGLARVVGQASIPSPDPYWIL